MGKQERAHHRALVISASPASRLRPVRIVRSEVRQIHQQYILASRASIGRAVSLHHAQTPQRISVVAIMFVVIFSISTNVA